MLVRSFVRPHSQWNSHCVRVRVRCTSPVDVAPQHIAQLRGTRNGVPPLLWRPCLCSEYFGVFSILCTLKRNYLCHQNAWHKSVCELRADVGGKKKEIVRLGGRLFFLFFFILFSQSVPLWHWRRCCVRVLFSIFFCRSSQSPFLPFSPSLHLYFPLF